ncbi:hypothetical protein F4778DRAFT_784423 [Xylariomycetidae sp. FL2044]|nr:hypothetical protein F4778DRAFT_784423 [Xylariomycetidae sp. FL2044]
MDRKEGNHPREPSIKPDHDHDVPDAARTNPGDERRTSTLSRTINNQQGIYAGAQQLPDYSGPQALSFAEMSLDAMTHRDESFRNEHLPYLNAASLAQGSGAGPSALPRQYSQFTQQGASTVEDVAPASGLVSSHQGHLNSLSGGGDTKPQIKTEPDASSTIDQGQPKVFAVVARREYARRDPAWFIRGRVFRILDDGGSEWISPERTMVILSGTGSPALLCLPLCRHWDSNEFGELSRPRIRVYKATPSSTAALPDPRWPYCPIKVLSNRALLSDVWINCEKPYTIDLTSIEVAHMGDIEKGSMDIVQDAYIRTQQEVTSRER